jgi:hypothetical protein
LAPKSSAARVSQSQISIMTTADSVSHVLVQERIEPHTTRSRPTRQAK